MKEKGHGRGGASWKQEFPSSNVTYGQEMNGGPLSVVRVKRGQTKRERTAIIRTEGWKTGK